MTKVIKSISQLGQAPVTPPNDKEPCQHQWFEVGKTDKSPECTCPDKDKLPHMDLWSEDHFIHGIKVQCANCEQVKELYGE